MTQDSTTATKADIDALTKTMEAGFKQMSRRFDSLNEHLEFTLGYVCKHAERIQKLEEHVGIAPVS